MPSVTNDAPTQAPPTHIHSSALRSGSDQLADLLEQEIAKATNYLHSLYLRKQAEIPQLRDAAESAAKERDAARFRVFEMERLLQEKSAEHQRTLVEYSDFRCMADVTNKRSASRIKELEAALSRSDSERIKERDLAAAAAAEVHRLNDSLAETKRQHEEEHDSSCKDAETKQTELAARIQQLEADVASVTAGRAAALIFAASTQADLKKAQTEARHVQGELNVMTSSLSKFGLEFVANGQTFTVTNPISRQILDLVDVHRKADALLQTLASLQPQVEVDRSSASSSPEVLSPFSLPVFITAVKEWLTNALAIGHGWELLYRQKEEEANALSEQLVQAHASVEEARSEARASAIAISKAEQSLKDIRALLNLAGLDIGVKDGKDRIIFTQELIGCINDMRPTVVQLRDIGGHLLKIYPTCGIDGLLKIEEPKPSSPHHLLVSTRKWLTVAQGIGSIFEGMYEAARGRIAVLEQQVTEKDQETKKVEERLMKRNREIDGLQKRLQEFPGLQPSSMAQRQIGTNAVKPGPPSTVSKLAPNKSQPSASVRTPCLPGSTQATQGPITNFHTTSSLVSRKRPLPAEQGPGDAKRARIQAAPFMRKKSVDSSH